MKIIQITSVPREGKQTTDSIYGLGEDGNVYWWDISTGKWELAVAQEGLSIV